jgi:hypothetical protein
MDGLSVEMQTCKKCGVGKLSTEFYPRNLQCRTCMNAKQRSRFQAKKEKELLGLGIRACSKCSRPFSWVKKSPGEAKMPRRTCQDCLLPKELERRRKVSATKTGRPNDKISEGHSRRELIVELKDVPCSDCGKRFHFCQMDFDHVRGIKLGYVPHMRTKQAILEEAAKCDVVCANCHRERTQRQRKGSLRVNPATVSMLWGRRGKPDGLSRRVAVSKPKRRQSRPWHGIVGTKLDKEVAAQFGISPASVCAYRKLLGIPRFTKLPISSTL